MKKLGIHINSSNDIKTQNITEDKDVTDLRRRYSKLFTENHTIKGINVGVKVKDGARLKQQKSRPIPIHLQPAVEKEFKKLIKPGHVRKAKNIDEKCFVSPTVITVKKTSR